MRWLPRRDVVAPSLRGDATAALPSSEEPILGDALMVEVGELTDIRRKVVPGTKKSRLPCESNRWKGVG